MRLVAASSKRALQWLAIRRNERQDLKLARTSSELQNSDYHPDRGFRQSESTMKGCRLVPTAHWYETVGKSLQLDAEAAGTIIHQSKDTLGHKASWHFPALASRIRRAFRNSHRISCHR
jgi:hypothetical protein